MYTCDKQRLSAYLVSIKYVLEEYQNIIKIIIIIGNYVAIGFSFWHKGFEYNIHNI